MRPVDAWVSLARLRQVAVVARDRAAFDLADADRRLTDCLQQRDASREREQRSAQGWAEHLGSSSPSPQFLMLWSHELSVCRAVMQTCDGEVGSAKQKLDVQRCILQAAEEKVRFLEGQCQKARRQRRDDRNEAVLSHIEDMHFYTRASA